MKDLRTSTFCHYKRRIESGRLAGFGAPIQGQQELYVHNDELSKAIPVIESIKLEMQNKSLTSLRGVSILRRRGNLNNRSCNKKIATVN